MSVGLRRFTEPKPQRRTGEQCELCGEAFGSEHGHVVNTESRAVLCACRGCYLLFTVDGAGGSRFRAVPDRYLHDPAFALSDAQWDELQIPVSMAFFFRNSALDRVVAFYPSPAGATESLLPLRTWAEVMAANPTFASVEPDVEALLLRRSPERIDCFLVPIDVCYELVGVVKLRWKGFDGGQEAWDEIDAFFSRLRERAT